MADHYAVLGVSRTATIEEIRAAYKKLAIQHHPDKGGKTSRFVMIQEAMEVLTDPIRRTEFDAGQDYDQHHDTGRHSDRKHKEKSGRSRQTHHDSDDEIPRHRQPRNADEFFRERDDEEETPQPKSPPTDEYNRSRSSPAKSLKELKWLLTEISDTYLDLYLRLWSCKSARSFSETWCHLRHVKERLSARFETLARETLELRISELQSGYKEGSLQPRDALLQMYTRMVAADARLALALNKQLRLLIPAADDVDQLLRRNPSQQIKDSDSIHELRSQMDCLRVWLVDNLHPG
ncbi:hypothetical protein H2204_014060 [Knufia peltigerae]|uniref:J domain-containing protein n=1 Tax=Knufia peltigerae TaxID=1002370 RepID=A0AA38XN63_9EURO|nr:hypothetical protein H2204_014060 [Knufia peltigerae]